MQIQEKPKFSFGCGGSNRGLHVEEILGIGRPYGKTPIIRSKPPKLQAFEETFLLHVDPPIINL